MLVEVRRDARTGDGALVHAQVETGRRRDMLDDPNRPLRQLGDLQGLLPGEVDVVGHVPVGADQQVAGVVRVEIADHVGGESAVHDQGIGIGAPWRPAEGALLFAAVGGLVLAVDVDHAIWRPQPLQRIRLPGQVTGFDDLRSSWFGHLRSRPLDRRCGATPPSLG